MTGISLLLSIFLTIIIAVGIILYIAVIVPANRRAVRRRLLAVSQGESASEFYDDSLIEGQGQEWARIERLLLRLDVGLRLRLWILQSGVGISLGQWILYTLLLAILGGLIAILGTLPFFLAITTVALLALMPTGWLAVKRQQRFFRFERQFPEALDMLGRAVRAGYAFTSGLKLIADELPEPVAGEFRKTFEQQNLGLPLREALSNLSVRMPLPDVRIFVSTLQIQSETGGNLAEVLDNLSKIVRERFRLLRQIRTYAAEGKLSLYILMVVPPGLAVMLFFLNRDYIMRLFTDPAGLRMVGVGIFLQFIGFLVIRKLIRIKV